MRFRVFQGLLAGLVLTVLAACGAPPPGKPDDVAQLRQAIAAMGPGVDPEEAARAAEIAYAHTHRLAQEYQITDPPLVHNTKVNMGIKPRGLCWHWAEDMETRLAAERFETLSLHRAIANADNPYRIDHSTVIVSAAGDGMYDGIVLDPWRKGGRLTWAPTRADTDYNWLPQVEAHAIIRAEKIAKGEVLPVRPR
jgi:hypothetical protein